MAAKNRLAESEKIFAFHDDVFMVTSLAQVGVAYTVMQEELFRHAGIQIQGIKTKGLQLRMTCRPECGGSGLVEVQQGIRVLGAPLGHPAFIADQSENLAVEHQTLLDRIPSLEDLQCGWALLLHCASARANHFIRVVRPECSHRFARLHDEGLWRCFCGLLDIPRDCVAPAIKCQCSLPLVLGGLGLRSATRTRQSAFWASWADALHMIHQRHPEVVVAGLSHPEGLPNLSGAAEAANCLRGVEDFEPPSWDELKLGARPQQFHEWDDHEPGGVQGWQHEASSRVERRHTTRDLFPVVTEKPNVL